MDKNLLARDEFLAKASLAGETLAEWLRWKLLKPAGYADDKSPLFAGEALDRAAHIRTLTELGYGTEEIQKILKKVGLPKKECGKKKDSGKDRFLTVGDLAEKSGVSPRTIKHWEDKGIIEPDMRTEGGFRLYSDGYVFLCKLILDLQLFGYTLEDIKTISDHFRDFLSLQAGPDALPKAETEAKLEAMLETIGALFEKTRQLKEGIGRWEDLLKKKRKEISSLRAKNEKRPEKPKGDADA
jgi:DNA-binding transcriptional MerR regulator